MPVRLEHLRFAWNGSNFCQFMTNVSKYPTHRASETIHAAKYSHLRWWFHLFEKHDDPSF